MTSPKLSELLAQRTRLDAEIAAMRERVREDWNDGLSAIESRMWEDAYENNWTTHNTERKNVRTVVLTSDTGAEVSVHLGFIYPSHDDWGACLIVRSATATIEFSSVNVTSDDQVSALVSVLMMFSAEES